MIGRRVVVVGGGVIGVACAHYLSNAGARVTVIDQGAIGGACSHGNCGFVCPSHVLPFAGPGAIGRTLKTLFQRNSPLKIRARFDPAMWGWFLRFARRCNRADMLEAGRAIAALLESSRGLFDELLMDAKLEIEWEPRGLLFAFRTHEAMEHYSRTDALLRGEFELGATRFDGPALTALEPALREGLAGGWHYECDAHLRPDKLMSAWRNRLESQSVTFRADTAVTGMECQHRLVAAVRTETDRIPADAVVVAAGAWTPRLSGMIGIRLPIQPGKGYSITVPRPANCPAIPLIFEEHRVAVTPFHTGLRIGSTMEFAGFDTSMNRSRLQLLRDGAAHYLREPVSLNTQEEWWGWRPMVPDGKPIIGRSPKYDNLWLAAGHGMLGLSMATGTGKLVAELIGGATPHIDPMPFRPERF